MEKGLLITLYGINNLGKTTQARLLSEKIRSKGLEVEQIKYPYYSIEPSGPFINNQLRGGGQTVSEEEFQLWYVLNRYQFQDRLLTLLDEGKIVLAEDYTGTGIAWGLAKGVEEEWICNVNNRLIKEDLAVLFEGERHFEALESNHIHEKNSDLMERSRKTHSYLADKFGWKRLTVQGGIDETAIKLWDIVGTFLVEKSVITKDNF